MKKISQILNRRFRDRSRRKAQRSTRLLCSEQLESRELLAADIYMHNEVRRSDVDNNGFVSYRDAMTVFLEVARQFNSTAALAEGAPGSASSGLPVYLDVTNDGKVKLDDFVVAANDALRGGAPGDPQVEYTHAVMIGGNLVGAGSTVNVGDVLVTEVLHQDVRQIGQPRFPDLTNESLKGLVASYNDFVYTSNGLLRDDVLMDTGGSPVSVLFGADYAFFNTSTNQNNPFPTFETPAVGDQAIRNVGGVQTDILSFQPTGPGKLLTYTVAIEVLGGNPQAANDNFAVDEGSTNNVLTPLTNDGVTNQLTFRNEFANGIDNEVLTLVANSNDLTSQRVPEEEIIFPTTSFPINGVALGGLTVIMTQFGTAIVNNNTISYTPPNSFVGTDEIVYQIDDGVGNMAEATITVSVGPVNDPPVNAVPGPQALNEDNSLAFSNVSLISVSDIDAGSEDMQVDLTVTNGTVTLGSVGGLTVTGDGSASVTATGTITNLNAGLSGLIYNPILDFNGLDTLTVTTNDLGNTGDGGPKTDIDTVVITVNPVNDAPINSLPSPPQTVVEGEVLLFNGGNAFSVSDVDAGGGTIRSEVSISTTDGPQVGTLNIATPGPVTVTGNGSSQVTLEGTLADVNTALDSLSYSAPLDLDGDVDLVFMTNDLGNTGSPGPLTDSDQLTITVEPAVRPRARQDAKEVVEKSVNNVIDVLINDTPSDGSQLLIESFTQPANGVVTRNDGGTPTVFTDDTLFYTPTNGVTAFNGQDTFTYVVNDTSNTTTATVEERTATVVVTVTEVNDPPTTTDDAFSTAEDTPLVLPQSSLTDDDSKGPANESGQTLNVTSVAMTSGLGSVVIDNGTVTYTPAADDNGMATFSYTVTDDGTTNGVADPLGLDATITITITEVNDPPTSTTDDDIGVKNFTTTYSIADLLSNDSTGPANESNQQLSVSDVTTLTDLGGTLELDGGVLRYTPPNPTFTGDDVLRYTITDNGTTNGASDPLTTPGELRLNVLDFVPSSFAGGSYFDFDGNGIWNSGEYGLGGVTITLSGTDFRGDSVIISQKTGADGLFSFDNLRPGSYSVNQTQPAGWMDGVETLALSSGTLGADMFSFDIGILGGLNSTGNQFGERGLHPSLWSIYNRSTAGIGLTGDGIVAAGDNSWFMILGNWDGVTGLQTSVNGVVSATATTSSGS
ncbi:MAG TPA: tandem-95 repeat protein, partial [Planctomycetes bacterium]|nr:tandem-95 repeat protein [Planctomycetota bacterium]